MTGQLHHLKMKALQIISTGDQNLTVKEPGLVPRAELASIFLFGLLQLSPQAGFIQLEIIICSNAAVARRGIWRRNEQ